MKKLITIVILALITVSPLARAENSIESDPAYLPIDKVLDLKATPPQVNVNLPRFLLQDALSGLTNNAPHNDLAGLDLPNLLKDVKLIRVVVMDVSKTNRPAVEKAVKTLRGELDSKWTSIVSVPDKKSSVGVYAMGDPAGETVAGMAVLVADEGSVVIVNIVGHVSIGKLMQIAKISGKLQKDLFKQFQVGGPPTPPSGATVEKGTNQPAEGADSKPKDSETK